MWFKKIIVGFLLSAAIGCTPPTSGGGTPADSGPKEPDINPTITWTECGGDIGDHGCDFTFKDQNGKDWRLYDHLGSVIVLDFSAMWCGYCRVAAAEVQAIQDQHGDKDFLWVTILVDDNTGNPPSLSDIQDWAAAYGITTAPILAGNREGNLIDTTAENGYPVSSWPTFIILDRDLIIQHGLHGWNESILRGWVLDILEE